VSGLSAAQFGGVLAAPPRRSRRMRNVVVGAALALVLAAACVIYTIYRDHPGGLVATLSGPGGQVESSAAFSPDGKTLAVSGSAGVSLWNIAAQRWITTLSSDKCSDGGQVAFSPDGKTLALFSGNAGTTCLWDVVTGQETTLADPDPRGDNGGTQGAFSPDGAMLAVADSTGDIALWNVATKRVTAAVASPATSGGVVAFSPDGTELAIGGDSTYVWDLTTKRWTATLTDPGNNLPFGTGYGGVNSLSFSQGGLLAVGDQDGSAYLWDAATRSLITSFTPSVNQGAGNASISKGPGDGGPFPEAGLFSTNDVAALSPDGKVVAAYTDFDYGTNLYDVATKKLIATLGDPGGISGPQTMGPQTPNTAVSLVFSPDAAMLAVTDYNGKTYLWSLSQLHLPS
jgi:WD40 repeat protein